MRASDIARLFSALLAIAAVTRTWAASVNAAESLGCLITPSRVTELGSPSAGVVHKVLIDRGDMVKEGQLLVMLKGEVERANVDLATARANAEADLQAATRAYEFARRKLERAQDLFRQEFVSAQAVDQAMAELQVAEARKAQAQEQTRNAKKELAVAAAQLDSRMLRSPVNGVVVDLYRRSGERVEDRPLLKIATLDPLHVEVVMPASMYGRVRSGAPVTIKPDLAGLKPLVGAVQVVDRVIDPASNTFRARIVLPNPDAAVPAGLRCQARFDEVATVAALPLSSNANKALP